MDSSPPRALIAEDEPLLATALERALAKAWPQLRIEATVGDGHAAEREALALLPDVLFFDIHMPGQTGLQAAAALVDEWPAQRPFPALVFLTAYDQYALQAFEAQALDYLLKPLQIERLHKTVARVQQLLAARAAQPLLPAATLAQLRSLLALAPAERAAAADCAAPAVSASAPALRFIQAGSGAHITMVPVADVLVFEAADKYVRVLTATHEHLIRTPLRELADQLEPGVFWQIHRGTLVRASAIARATRSEVGKLSLSLHGRPETFVVSRLYAGQFRAM